MAVIPIDIVDSTPYARKWEMPQNYEGLRSPIPRGFITFSGSDPVATLGAGDETSYKLKVVMPEGFAYLPKVMHLRFVSDDLVAQFGNEGFAIYIRAEDTILCQFSIQSPGKTINQAVTGEQEYGPLATTPKLLLAGGDSIAFRLSDMSAGGSTAGDMLYFIQLYVFDVDQVDKWEVNTPIPTISHTAF